MNIYPAILTDELGVAQKQLVLCEESGLVQTVQIDIIDGYFADNITITPGSLFDLHLGELELDFHLMTQEPIDYVYELADYKEELPVRAVIAQVEQMSNQELFVEEVRRNNWNAGLSLNIHTPLSAIETQIWDRIQIVQLMSITAGAQGQKFNELVFEKITQLREMMTLKDLKLEIIVDGGVDPTVLSRLQEYGVSGVGVGSYLWKAENFSEAYEDLETSLL